MGKKKKILWGITLVVECLILISCLGFCKKEAVHIVFQPSEFKSEGVFMEQFLDTGLTGYYIDSSFGEVSDFASTETIDLAPGCYSLKIYYAAEGNPQRYTIDKKNADFRFWKGNWHEELPTGKNLYEASICSISRMKDFGITFDFNGDGYILVGQVEITEQKTWAFIALPFLLIFFIILDMAIWKRDKIYSYFADAAHRMQWFGCCFIILSASLPLFAPGLLRGHDLEFHLLRIEGIREGLLSGQFPVKIQPNWMNGYGYGTSVFYGDIFLYMPALLRLCGIGVQGAYKAFVFVTNAAVCLLSYYAFKRFSGDYRIGLLGSFLYTCSVYRLACVYIRAAVGEYSAMTFLPLFFVGIYEILFDGNRRTAKSGVKENRIESWLLAAFSYSGILYSHMISSEIMALFTIFVGGGFWRRTFQKDRMKQILKCGTVILGCSLGFLVPFLDMSRDAYWFNSIEKDSGMQTYGAAFDQIFSIFPNGAGEALSYTMIERTMGNGNEMPYALGGGFLAAVVLFLIYYIYYGFRKEEKVRKCKNFLIFAVFAIWMTTSVFPWNFLQMIMGPLKFMVQNIQFPWRILGVSTLILTFFVCMAVDIFAGWPKYGIAAIAMTIGFSILSSSYFLNERMTDNFSWCVQNADKLDDFHYMGGEYIPKGGEYADKSVTVLEYSPEIELRQQERSYHRFKVSCGNQGEKEGYIDMPLLYYRGYVAEDVVSGSKLEVVKSETSKVRVIIPAGYNGEFLLNYREYWYWRIAELISLLCVAGIVCVYLIKRIRRGMFQGNSALKKQDLQ